MDATLQSQSKHPSGTLSCQWEHQVGWKMDQHWEMCEETGLALGLLPKSGSKTSVSKTQDTWVGGLPGTVHEQ